MTSVEHTVEIRAPIEHVFDAATDPRRASEWNPSVLSVTEFSGSPMGVGTTWRQVTLLGGRAVNLQASVSRFEPPNMGVAEMSGGQRGRIWTRCEPIEGGTRLTQGIEFNLPGGALGAMAGKMIGGIVARELARAMERQRNQLENRGKHKDVG